jgi:hypothetical protein
MKKGTLIPITKNSSMLKNELLRDFFEQFNRIESVLISKEKDDEQIRNNNSSKFDLQ